MPALRTALGAGKKLDVLLLLETTAAAHAAYSAVGTLAAQLANLSTAHGFSGINIDYEAQCCDYISSE